MNPVFRQTGFTFFMLCQRWTWQYWNSHICPQSWGRPAISAASSTKEVPCTISFYSIFIPDVIKHGALLLPDCPSTTCFFLAFLKTYFLIFFNHLSFIYYYYYFFYFTILYWFCRTSTWIHHGCTRVPHPEPPSSPNLPSRTIPLGHPSAPAPSILYHASNLDWWFVSYMILHMFQCHSPKSSHPLSLPQSPKDCSIHLCLFCCLAYRVIITVFLNSIYMH